MTNLPFIAGLTGLESKSRIKDFEVVKDSSQDKLIAECFIPLFMIFAFASSPDLFIGLSAPVVISQSEYCGFGFTTQLKTSLI